MIDLHTHILPNIDDGPASVGDSLRLLQMESETGVDAVAFTPHFFAPAADPENFFVRRAQARARLLDAAAQYGPTVRTVCGAEVMLSARLLTLPACERFCYEGTRVMLVEFPTDFYQSWIVQVLYGLKVNGITPMIAHIERYRYFRNNFNCLKEIIDAGSIAQVNASAILSENYRTRRYIGKLFRNHLVHVVASATHSAPRRPHVLAAAMAKVEKRFGKENARRISEIGELIFRGRASEIR